MPDVIDYAGASDGGRVGPFPLAAAFAVAQVFWFMPAAIMTWVFLCDTARAGRAGAEVAATFVVCAPSFGAAWCGTRGAFRREWPRSRRRLAAASAIFAAGVMAFAFGSTVHALHHPPQFWCL